MSRDFYCYDVRLVSLTAMKSDAERIAMNGEKATVHLHSYGKMCSEFEHFVYYTPQQKKDIEEFTKLTTKEKTNDN